MKFKNLSMLVSSVVYLGVACNSDNSQDISPEQLFTKPANFPAPVYNFDKNPMSVAGFELGKELFNDGDLSRDGSIACADCHNQAYAFTHHGHDVSHGIDNLKGVRNAPPIQNMAFQKEFFWDGGVFDLDLFSIAPIENPLEMDEKLGNVLEKLRKKEKYATLFQKAYGSKEITTERFLKALSQFMNALVSANSRYDKYVRKEQGGILTEDELAGLEVFKQKCASCHSGELFTDQSYRNNGLPVYNLDDTGRGRITQNRKDEYTFKVPSLRNIEVSAPYMHDGRFYSLEAVLNHYNDGIVDSPTLDTSLKNGSKLGIQTTADEQKKLIAFLKTLTDNDFLKNKRFGIQ
ncbi:Di-heme cytochrome c peroxidase [Emticicia oligotrophica DSM 17448]|uniref:Di-heme cytochrome c peroxidase n=1 Tax=Emticicia oligotrophica (strain DSM 17448 / CIP 109782 / MTCC 6937 / GPTSA100-15) TaxID=929562 RepID=A0ABM5MXH0_EMTOG|nr:cytochrome c peroxidase [Emticicia oligotrophica]AFK01842.1 Di-heme cytochrome c peroxidase [Emticicia oligotrophica DSM 17448]